MNFDRMAAMEGLRRLVREALRVAEPLERRVPRTRLRALLLLGVVHPAAAPALLHQRHRLHPLLRPLCTFHIRQTDNESARS